MSIHCHRQLTSKELMKGWIDTECGHAFVFKTTVKYNPIKDVEYCDHFGYRWLAIKAENLKINK